MADYIKLEALASDVLAEMARLRYSKATVTGFRRMLNAYIRYANDRGIEEFAEMDAVIYLNSRFGVALEHLYQSNPGGAYLKAWLRTMRTLMEFKECGCICKRMPGELKRTELPPGLRSLLDSFNEASRRSGHSASTVYSRNGRIKHFLLFLAQGGGEDVSCINETSAHDYILTKSSNHAKSVKTILTAIRCFLKHLYLEGLIDRDLTDTVPNPKLYYAPSLPSTWTKEEVDALMSGIDRGNPVGKRDYAMLLMVARLGLRASDIKTIRISDFDWGMRRISLTQHKTGVALELPLLDDVGWAVIDYLREGRPDAATCSELFVRQLAPFDAFGETSNLTNILIKRARAAGVKAPRDHKTLHSLRHALAKRLLEQQVPLDDISRILGHVNKRTTSIYLRMDVESLAACPLDPEAVAI